MGGKHQNKRGTGRKLEQPLKVKKWKKKQQREEKTIEKLQWRSVTLFTLCLWECISLSVAFSLSLSSVMFNSKLVFCLWNRSSSLSICWKIEMGKNMKLVHFFLKCHATETVPIGVKVCSITRNIWVVFLCNYNCKISSCWRKYLVVQTWRHNQPQLVTLARTHARAKQIYFMAKISCPLKIF